MNGPSLLVRQTFEIRKFICEKKFGGEICKPMNS